MNRNVSCGLLRRCYSSSILSAMANIRCYSSDSATEVGSTSKDERPRGGGEDKGNSYLVLSEDDSDLLPRDVQNKIANDFFDYANRRCTLCNEPILGNFQGHVMFPTHQARVGIVQRALTGMAGTPSTLPERWWLLLHDSIDENSIHFNRLGSLSHRNKRMRRRRVCYLLDFVKRRGVIRDSLGLYKGGASLTTIGQSPEVTTSFTRTFSFERFEMIGDSVLKFLIPDRLFRMFPAEDGGPTGQLALVQQMLDSNDGLLRIYDYLDLDSLIGVKLPNSKTKSDVIESLFGELQCFLWATEASLCQEGGLDSDSMFNVGPDGFILPPELRYMRTVVNHLLNEIAHCVLVWACESALENAREFIATHYDASSKHAKGVIERRGGALHQAVLKKNRSSTTSAPLSARGAVLSTSALPTIFPGSPIGLATNEFYKLIPSISTIQSTAAQMKARFLAARNPPPSKLTAPYFSRVRNRAAPPLHVGTALSWRLKPSHNESTFFKEVKQKQTDSGSVSLIPAPFLTVDPSSPIATQPTCMAPPVDTPRHALCRALNVCCNTTPGTWNIEDRLREASRKLQVEEGEELYQLDQLLDTPTNPEESEFEGLCIALEPSLQSEATVLT